jgi:hypothetical protein
VGGRLQGQVSFRKGGLVCHANGKHSLARGQEKRQLRKRHTASGAAEKIVSKQNVFQSLS